MFAKHFTKFSFWIVAAEVLISLWHMDLVSFGYIPCSSIAGSMLVIVLIFEMVPTVFCIFRVLSLVLEIRHLRWLVQVHCIPVTSWLPRVTYLMLEHIYLIVRFSFFQCPSASVWAWEGLHCSPSEVFPKHQQVIQIPPSKLFNTFL